MLDGLDELPEQLQSKAISTLNRYLRLFDQLIMTSRTTEFEKAVKTAGVLASAVSATPSAAASGGHRIRTGQHGNRFWPACALFPLRLPFYLQTLPACWQDSSQSHSICGCCALCTWILTVLIMPRKHC